jgi:quinol monooxygenase YgiN
MIKHITMWKLKGEGAAKQDSIRRVKTALETCKGIVPGMLKYEIGVDLGIGNAPWDIVVYSEFSSREALDAYHEHPAHVAIKPVVAEARESRGMVDYEA